MESSEIGDFSNYLKRYIKSKKQLYETIIGFWDNLYSDGVRDIDEFFSLTCKYFPVSREYLDDMWLVFLSKMKI